MGQEQQKHSRNYKILSPRKIKLQEICLLINPFASPKCLQNATQTFFKIEERQAFLQRTP